MADERLQGGGGGAARKILATMWECSWCGYANFRRAAGCRSCERVRAYGSRLVQQWWVASALPAGWDHEPRRPLARRGGFGAGGGILGHGGGNSGGGGAQGRSEGPIGAGNSRPMVLRRGGGNSDDVCPTVSLAQRNAQNQTVGGSMARGTATRNRWTAPPSNRPGDVRLDAPGTLDGGRVGGRAGAGGADGWQEGLNKIQRKRIRQRAKRKQEGGGGDGGGEAQEDSSGSTNEEDEEDVNDEDKKAREPVRPYQPPPMPRLLCVRQAEQLQKRLEAMQQKGSRPQLLQKAERRLEDARRLVREAGGPTERRLVFSILQEETRERKLREALPRADQEVADRAAQVLEAQKALEEAKKKKIDLETRWRNSKARAAFLASEKAAETLPQEQTAAVHEALQAILVGAPPAMQAQARLVSEYFRSVAPLPARLPEETFYELSDGDTQDESQAMDGVEETGRHGTKRDMQEAQIGGAVLPAPARNASSLEEARSQVAQLRHQKLAAISAAFDRSSAAPGQIPLLAPAELADRYDCEMQRALEQVRAYTAAEAEAREPTPCQHGEMPHAGGAREGGAADRGEGGNEEDRGGKAARREEAASSKEGEGNGVAAAGGRIDPEEPRGEEPGSQPTRTKWEQLQQGPPRPAGSELPPPGPRPELECPGCGRGPMAREALQGQCECGAAVCIECSEGGITINSCLVCFDRCEEPMVSGEAMEGKAAPGPLAFAGTLSGDGHGRSAPRRATPY